MFIYIIPLLVAGLSLSLSTWSSAPDGGSKALVSGLVTISKKVVYNYCRQLLKTTTLSG